MCLKLSTLMGHKYNSETWEIVSVVFWNGFLAPNWPLIPLSIWGFEFCIFNAEEIMECLRCPLKEFLTTEVLVLQEQMCALQVKLDEEEHKNLKLQQHIDKLEHHSTQMQEVRPWALPQKIYETDPQSKSIPGRKWLYEALVKVYLSCILYFVTSPTIMRHTSLVWI